ncbi:type II toxin-antitoxin system Phd/YefM family antitoxin [candidate division KSB1 bacterium]|nr:type II toxin-antitoxin system Phd/YefM family antitoxin [candidate division KSB1 bacterium]
MDSEFQNTSLEVEIEEIENDFPSYFHHVEDGETVVVLKDGVPLAEIKPIYFQNQAIRPFGLCKGEFILPDDFDDPLPEEILEEFEGK